MKTNKYQKVVVNGNFHSLQMLRNIIKDEFKVRNVLWGGRWDGMKWENFSFYCNPEIVEDIKSFAKRNIEGTLTFSIS